MTFCEKCGEELSEVKHHCLGRAKTISAYIRIQEVEIQPILQKVDSVIREVLLNAESGIKWGMPSYWEDRNIMHFAAHKKYFNLYTGAEAIEKFDHQLESYVTTKGAIKFPYDQTIDYDLIKKITEWCYQTGNHH
ncbi:DUF1801 domain-containing protein [Facklamia sp. DSM 111018]|uniref:DUF1801 domain-containing protein n=1 Tax=Facklamia lactis TaxID=2749967 RepID=A0ABS0LMN9_9LACT|nr:DUF1801 domain-containing protein [Facklamia lactis]MBG9979911.1 DUF1801 domain-containing protein [Facklamia lactis]MBG9985409.1 DUF1801 domain-containing protein [Facklamia lactis]